MSPKFSSLTVTYNDQAHLDECLSSLNFCEEKIVIDLGSKDSSIDIAKKYKAKIYKWERREIIEEIKERAIRLPKNDWIIFIDPDEIFPELKTAEIKKCINDNTDLGAISVLIHNYFLGRFVKYGRWRPYYHNGRIIYRPAVIFNDHIHSGMKFNKGFKSIAVPDLIIKHYWIDTLDQFYEKHSRYLKYEGKTRYQKNQRYSTGKMLSGLIKKFFTVAFVGRGIYDFHNNWQLLRLAMWYEYEAWISLKKFQETIK